MASVFDLKTSAEQLPSLNQGTSRICFQQVQALRDVTGTSFSGGEINFRWEVSGSRWFIAARSYMRLKCTYTVAGAAPLPYQDLSVNMGLMANLFQSCEFRMADKIVSRIDSYLAQVDALSKRTNKSRSWLNSSGKMEWWQPTFEERRAELTQGGQLDSDYQIYNPEVTGAAYGWIAGGNGNQIEYDGASTITFTANGGLAINLYGNGVSIGVPVGSIIRGTGGVLTPYTFKVLEILTNASARVELLRSPDPPAVVAATNLNENTSWAIPAPHNVAMGKNSFDVIWSIPLSIFKIQHALPAGRYQLTLQPQDVNSYKLRSAESRIAALVPGGGAGQFDFNVDEMHFYIATVEGPRVDNLTYYLSLDEIRVQPQDITGGTGLEQKNYDISPSSYALATFFQSRNAGVNTLNSASRFKIPTALDGAVGAAKRVTYPDGQETALKRLFILFGGQNKPSPDADWEFKDNIAGGNKLNQFNQAYAETQMYNGGYFDDGGYETFREYLDRGMYFYYSWPRDGDDRSTRVAVNFSFETALDANVGTVLLADFYKRIVIVQIVDGRIVDIIEMDA